ncbi:MAG: alpha/beta hydrolase [Clostridia bacterium]|nr:alpha/beta hydrolase [Clostridia bacterium]
MKNIFLIHSLNGNTIDSFAGSVEKFCKDNNIDYYYPIFPIRAEASPESWGKILDEYKDKGILNSDSMVITHSIGTKIVPKYLVKNNLSIDTFVSVAGFVDYSGTRTDYIVDVMRITKVSDEEFDRCKSLVKNRFSIYSDNDSNSPLEKCIKYAEKLGAEKIFVKGAGHFTQKDNITEIKELNEIMKEYINK